MRRFIDRYIPGYVFFSDGIESGYTDDEHRDADGDVSADFDDDPEPESSAGSDPGSEKRSPARPRWIGHGLKVIIDGERKLVGVGRF